MDSEIEAKETQGQPEQVNTEVQEEVRQPPTPPNTRHFSLDFAGKRIELDYESIVGPCVGQFVAAVVLLISVVVFPIRINYGFGIAASVIAILSSLFGTYIANNSNIGNRVLGQVPLLGDLTVHSANAMFLFIWWIVTTGVLTFNGPFIETGNGYLAVWAGFILSIIGLSHHIEPMKTFSDEQNLFRNGLLISSIVLICAVGIYVNTFPEAVYALVIAIITVVLVMMQQFGLNGSLSGIMIYRGLALSWLILAVVTTFRAPFTTTGNGYFASWGGFFFCIKCAMKTYESPSGDIEMTEEDPDQAAV